MSSYVPTGYFAAGLGAGVSGFAGIRPFVDITGPPYYAVADGDGNGGGTDNAAAFQAANDALAAAGGGVIVAPIGGTGTYLINTQLNMSSGVQIRGYGYPVFDISNQTSSSIGIYYLGSFGSATNLSALASRGDVTISTSSAHGLVKNDWFLLWSALPCMTSDAPDQWRLGQEAGTSPYYAEPCQVKTAPTTTSIAISTSTFGGIMYPTYDTSGPAGRTCSTVQEINFIRGAVVTGIVFVSKGAHCVRFDTCYMPILEDCYFRMIDASNSDNQVVGQSVAMYSCLEGRVNAARTRRTANYDPDGGGHTHDEFNAYKDVGSWLSRWDVEDENGSQSIDLTYSSGKWTCISPRVRMKSVGAKFAGATSHSGAYNAQFVDGEFKGCRTGITMRSRFGQISRNQIIGPSNVAIGGIQASGWAVDLDISDNFIDGYPYGIVTIPTDVITGPLTRNTTISKNKLRRCTINIWLRQASSSPETALPSGISVINNDIDYWGNYGVLNDAYVNNVVCLGNRIGTIYGQTAISPLGIDIVTNSVGWLVDNNIGDAIGGVPVVVSNAVDNGAGLVRLTVSSTSTLPASKSVRVEGVGGVPGANGTYVATIIDGTTLDLVASTFSGAYTSGGVVYNGAILISTVAVTDTTTFPVAQYPTNQHRVGL